MIRFLPYLLKTTLAVWLCVVAASVSATDVPFSSRNSVDNDFNDARSVYAADVDGDGDMDVLGAAFDEDGITWWENTAGDGSAWTEHTVDVAFDGARFVYAADVDGDGDMDVLGAAEIDNDITWWENTAGDGSTWTEHTVDGDFLQAFSVYAADVDGDGDTDVLGAARDVGGITWWENTAGDGSAWTKHNVTVSPSESVYAEDVDGDGDMDILAAADVADDITWWENTAGDGSAWTKHTVDGFFNGAESVYAEDVDDDGDMDILGAALSSFGEIAWWENTAGDGTAWTKHIVDGAFHAISVFAADVDGDHQYRRNNARDAGSLMPRFHYKAVAANGEILKADARISGVCVWSNLSLWVTD